MPESGKQSTVKRSMREDAGSDPEGESGRKPSKEQYAERYYIRTIVSDRIRDTQDGSQSQAGRYSPVYHIIVLF